MNNFRLLTLEEVYREKKLSFFKKGYEIKCNITDFAILLAGYEMQDSYYGYNDRIGYWWLDLTSEWRKEKKFVSSKETHVVRTNVEGMFYDGDERDGGFRPAISYSNIASDCKCRNEIEDGIFVVEYGEYPQNVVTKEFAEALESAYLSGTIKKQVKVIQLILLI